VKILEENTDKSWELLNILSRACQGFDVFSDLLGKK
jgi:hypothetical protein